MIKNIKSYKIIICCYFLTIGALVFAQFNIPDKPTLQTSVYDYASMLNKQEKIALETKLINYADTTTTQIVIVTVPTINGENIGLLSARWAHQWGIGQAKEDNGVFILLAQQERSIWISPGYGVEDRLTAGITGEIVRKIIIPEFKSNNYYNGLDKGTTAIFKVLNGKYKGRPNQATNNDASTIAGFLLFFIIVFIFIIIANKGKNNGRGNSGNGGKKNNLDLGDIILLSNLGRGFGSGRSSGGGFSGGFGGGFGGGGFSGGGSGGRW